MLIEGVARTVGHPPDLDVSRSAQILAKFPVVNKVLILGGYAGPHDLLRKNRQWQLIFEARSLFFCPNAPFTCLVDLVMALAPFDRAREWDEGWSKLPLMHEKGHPDDARRKAISRLRQLLPDPTIIETCERGTHKGEHRIRSDLTRCDVAVDDHFLACRLPPIAKFFQSHFDVVLSPKDVPNSFPCQRPA